MADLWPIAIVPGLACLFWLVAVVVLVRAQERDRLRMQSLPRPEWPGV